MDKVKKPNSASKGNQNPEHIEESYPITITNGKHPKPREPRRHLISKEKANSYIDAWCAFKEDLNKLLELTSQSKLDSNGTEIRKLTKKINDNLLISSERFSLVNNGFTKNFQLLLSKSHSLDIHFGIKPTTDLDKKTQNKLIEKGFKQNNISCVALVGRDKNGVIVNIKTKPDQKQKK